MTNQFEVDFYENFYRLKRQIESRPLILGGTSGEDGGSGGPAGGFIGWLPQNRVAYDSTQASSNVVPPSGASLIDNLNYIRWRIDNIIVSGGMGTPLEVEWDDSSIRTGVDVINFEGNVSVTDEGLGKVTVAIPEDRYVKRSATDTTPGYLSDKLLAGSNVSFEVVNSGANEQLRLHATMVFSGGIPSSILTTENDVIPGFLNQKLQTDGLIKSIEFDETIGEYVNLEASFTSLTDTPENYTGQENKWVKVNALGDGLEFSDLPEGNQQPIDEAVKISLEDQISDYLENKLVAGNNVAITKLFAGGNEQLRVSASVSVSGELSNLNIQHNDANIAPGVTILNFEGDVSVVEDEAGKATVTISGGGTGGVNEFTELTDTPNDYTGHSEKLVRVNTGETGLEFYELSVSGGGGMSLEDHLAIGNEAPHHAPVTLGIDSDPALSLSGQELTLTLPTASGSGATTFLELTDTPSDYTGQNGLILAVNPEGDGIEFTTVSGVGQNLEALDFMRIFPSYLACDFHSTTADSIAPFEVYSLNGGVIALEQSTALGENLNHPGIVTLNTAFSFIGNSGVGVWTGSTAGLRLKANTEIEAIFRIGNRTWDIGAPFFFPPIPTEGYFGAVDTINETEPNNGAYILFTETSIYGRTRNTTLGQSATTSTSLSTDYLHLNNINATWYRARVKINDAANRVDFYVYNADTDELLWSDYLDTALPPTTIPMRYGISAHHIYTTTSYSNLGLVSLDWMALKIRGDNELGRILGGVISTSGKTMVTETDDAPDYLESKLVAGNNISITTLNPGGDAQLLISATVSGGGSGGVLVSDTDVVPDYLEDKLIFSGASTSIQDLVEGFPEFGKVMKVDIPETFISLLDTPNSFVGQSGKTVVVNVGETALEFVSNPDSFLNLSDTPASYIANRYIQTNSSADGLQSGVFTGTFLSLSDTSSSYNFGEAGKSVYAKVNVSRTALNMGNVAFAGDLTDTPTSFAGHGGEYVIVDDSEDRLAFQEISLSGAVEIESGLEFTRNFPWMATDFFGVTTTSNPPFTLTSIASGTLTQDTTSYDSTYHRHPGCASLNTSSSAGSGIALTTDLSLGIVPNLEYECIFKAPNYEGTVYFGLFDNVTAAEPTYMIGGRLSAGGTFESAIKYGNMYTQYMGGARGGDWYRFVMKTSPNYDATYTTIPEYIDFFIYNDDTGELLYSVRESSSSVFYAGPNRLRAGIKATRTTLSITSMIVVDWMSVRVRQDNDITDLVVPNFTISGSDQWAKVSTTDTTQGYLEEKIIEGAGITIAKLDTDGYEQLEINANNQTVLQLLDTPAAYSGSGGKILRVKLGEDGVEFISPEVASSSLLVKEEDDIPTVSGVTEIIVPSGSMTDLGGGSIRIDFNQRPLLDAGLQARSSSILSMDFLHGVSAATNIGWTFATQSSGTVTTIATSETINHPGICQINNTATSTSGYLFRSTLSNFYSKTPGLFYEIIFKLFVVPNVLSYIGLNTGSSMVNVPQGSFIHFYLNQDGSLMGGTRIASPFALNYTPTSYIVNTNIWYRARLEVNSLANGVNFYLYNDNNIVLWHDSLDDTSMPNTGLGAFSGFWNFNGVAASPFVYIDLITAGYNNLVR